MKNKIYITNEEEDISIEMLLSSDSATGGEQLIIRSVKALLRSTQSTERAHGADSIPIWTKSRARCTMLRQKPDGANTSEHEK